MKLYYSPTSPFVRKVVVAAHEKGLADRVEIIETNPHTGPDALERDNPLGKVPALIDDDGQSLYDSLVICHHLDALTPEPKLVPDDPVARTVMLRRHALADGILEAAIMCVMESRRPEDKRWPDAIERQKGKIHRGLDALEGEIEEIGNAPDLATITTGCALDYVAFRLPDVKWEEGRPNLAQWMAEFSKRPSMAGTQPKDPA